MDNMESASLTKGCFVHKPSKLQRKKSSNTKAYREKNCKVQSLWEDVALRIKKIEKRSNIEAFDNIVEFINKCYKFPLTKVEEVPSAVLVMGLNMSDHSNLFHLLETYLHTKEIHSTVILDSKKCSNMPNTLQVIVHELLTKYKEFLPFGDGLPKKQECCFTKVVECFENLNRFAHINRTTINKKKDPLCKKIRNRTKALVLLIQDVESFSAELLQELILLCKIYSGKLPIILIFGMASAMVTLHSILSQKALSCVGIEYIYSLPATEYLSRIIEEVIMCPELPFKLGYKLFQLIVDTVLYHDFSLSNLTYFLKFAMLEHLYGKSVTSLCCSESEIEERVGQLNNENLQVIKKLPSLRKYQENNSQFVSCINDNIAFKESIIGFVKDLFCRQKTSLILLEVLHHFVKDLPGYPLGKLHRELYAMSLQENIYSSEAFAEAQNLFKMLSLNSLLYKLENCLPILKDSNCKNSLIEKTIQTIQNSMEELNLLKKRDFQNIPDPKPLENEKIISRFQLQEKLQMSMKLKRSHLDAAKSEIIDNLLLIFKNILYPADLPLYEIFYFDDISSVKKHLMAVPRVTLCFCLSNPEYYLKCACCKVVESEEICPSMPDISILYKLHLESGKLINLCDWLEAFKAIKNSEENVCEGPKMKNKANDDELNIRFLQAVSELQMLGFIKPTKRKTDHVARLTFGSF